MLKNLFKSKEEIETSSQIRRKLEKTDKKIVYFLSILMAVIQIYLIIFSMVPPMISTGVFLAFIVLLVFLLYKPSHKIKSNSIPWYDWLAAMISATPFVYGVIYYDEIIARTIYPNTVDITMMIIAVLAVLEISRRTLGIILPVIALIFILYAMWGGNLPGVFAHQGYSLERLTNTFFMTTNGIYGAPSKVAATMVFMFVFFGAFLNKTGASRIITDGSFAIAGRYTGGPAKVAIIASGLLGSVSGSASANVATSGPVTIPLMKKVGYKKNFAAAVEASASTGGTIVPPILGAAAFIMAEITGIPYGEIVIASVIPAFLYYLTVFVSVHFEAKRLGLKGLPKDQLPNAYEVFKEGIFVLLSLVLLVTLILMYYPIMHAAFYSTIALILLSLIKASTRINIRGILSAISDSAHMVLQAAAACACAGIVIGVLNLTGLGIRFSSAALSIAESTPFLTLIFTMVILIILGMGLPPVAAYIIGASVAAPALINMGFSVLASHLFIFYFSAISSITPPVAVTAYIAAGIAESNPLRTAIRACFLGLPAFVVPFMFMYSEQYLLVGTPMEIIVYLIPALIGFIFISTGIIGYFNKNLILLEKTAFIIGGILLLFVTPIAIMIGIVILLTIIIYHYRRKTDSEQMAFIKEAK